MDIKKLALTDTAIRRIAHDSNAEMLVVYAEHLERLKPFADAQLAKALWGIVEWLETCQPTSFAEVLKEALEYEGIERPKA